MIVGLDDWRPEDADSFRDLGVTWTKMGCSGIGDADGALDEGYLAKVQAAHEAGMTVITDLRPDGDVHKRLSELLGERDGAEGRDLQARIGESVAAHVQAAGAFCSRWEFWGEFDCPFVGGIWPGKEVVYPVLLSAVATAIRGEQPDAQVWNGGYGVNFQPQFIDGLVHEAPDAFTHANWHHYNISEYWPRDSRGNFVFNAPMKDRRFDTASKFKRMFNDTRARMTAAGCTQPFVSSEWGMPVVSDEAADACKGIKLYSAVFDEEAGVEALVEHPLYFEFRDGVYGLGDREGAAFFDDWMAAFEECGFEVLIYHRLYDTPTPEADADGTFWGLYCGLHYPDRTPKTAMVKTFRKWVERGKA